MLNLQASTALTTAADYLSDLAVVLREIPHAPMAEMIDALLEARTSGRRVYILGNGGSAATASHMVCDLVKTARVSGQPALRVFGLTDNTPLLTAWANDSAYDHCFAEQILALVEAGDLVIVISASGNSPNILAGLQAARERAARTVALVGFEGGLASGLADIVVHVPCRDYGLVEDAHAAIGHAVAMALKRATVDLVSALP